MNPIWGQAGVRMSFLELVRIACVWILLAGLAGAAWFLLKTKLDEGAREKDKPMLLRQNRKGLLTSLAVVLVAGFIGYQAGTANQKAMAKVEAEQNAGEAAERAKKNAIIERQELAERCRGRLSPQEKASIGVCDRQGSGGSESLSGSASCFAELNELERDCVAAGY